MAPATELGSLILNTGALVSFWLHLDRQAGNARERADPLKSAPS